MAYVLSNSLATFTFDADGTTGLKLVSFKRGDVDAHVWTNADPNMWRAKVFDTTSGTPWNTSTITPLIANLAAVTVQRDFESSFFVATWANIAVGADRLTVTLTLRLKDDEDWLRVNIRANWTAAATYALDSLSPLPLMMDPFNNPNDFAVVPAIRGILSENPIFNLGYFPTLGRAITGWALSTTNTWSYPVGRGWVVPLWGYYERITREGWMIWVEDWSKEVFSTRFESDATRLNWETYQPQEDHILVGNNGRALGSGYTFCFRPMIADDWWDMGRHYRSRLIALEPDHWIPVREDRTDLSDLEKAYSLFVDVNLLDTSHTLGDGSPGDILGAINNLIEGAGLPPQTQVGGVCEPDFDAGYGETGYNLPLVGETPNGDLQAKLLDLYQNHDIYLGVLRSDAVGPLIWDIRRWNQALGDQAELRWWTSNDVLGALRMSRAGRLGGAGNDRLVEQPASRFYRERTYAVTGWNPGTKTVAVVGNPNLDGFTTTNEAILIPASGAARLAKATVSVLGAGTVQVTADFTDGLGAPVTPAGGDTLCVYNLVDQGSQTYVGLYCPHAQINATAYFDRLKVNASSGLVDSFGCAGFFMDTYDDPNLQTQLSSRRLCYRDHTGWSKINPGYIQHPLGGGAWHIEAKLDYIAQLKAAAKALQPADKKIFIATCEDSSEIANGYFDWDWRDIGSGDLWRVMDSAVTPSNNNDGYKAIPLVQSIYDNRITGRALNEQLATWMLLDIFPFNDPTYHAHVGYAMFNEWPLGTKMAVTLFQADGIDFGNYFDDSQYVSGGGTISDTVKALRDFWVQCVRAEFNWLTKYTVNGEFMPLATIDYGTTSVTTGLADGPYAGQYNNYDVIYERATHPRVTHGIWKAKDGAICVVLSNWTDTAGDWKGVIPALKCGLGEPGGVTIERTVVRKVDEDGIEDGTATFDTATASLTVSAIPAYSAAFVLLQNTAPPAELVTRLMPSQSPVNIKPNKGVNLSPSDTIGKDEAIVANNVEHSNGTLAKRKGYRNVLTATNDAVLKGGASSQSLSVVGEEWWMQRLSQMQAARIEPNAIGSDVSGRRDFFNERPSFIVIPEGSQTGIRLDVQAGDPDWAIEFCFTAEMLPTIPSNGNDYLSPMMVTILAQKGYGVNGQWAVRFIPDATSTDRFYAVLTLYEAGVLGAAGAPAGVDFFYSAGAARAWVEPGKRTWVAWKFNDSGGGGDIVSYYRTEGMTSVVSSSQNVNATSATLRANGVGTGTYPITVGRRPYQAAGRFGIGAAAAANSRVIDEIGFVGSPPEMRFWLETAQGAAATLELPANWATVTAAPPASTDWYVESEIPEEQLTADASVEASSIVRTSDLQLYYQFKPELIGTNPDGSTNAGENHRFIRPRYTRGTATDNLAWITGSDVTWVNGTGALGSKALAMLPAGPTGQKYAYALATARSGDLNSLFGQRVFCGGIRVPNSDNYLNRATTSTTGYIFPNEFAVRVVFRLDAFPVDGITNYTATLAELNVARTGAGPNEDRYNVSTIFRVAVVNAGGGAADWHVRFTMRDGAGAASANVDSTTLVTEGAIIEAVAAVKFDGTNRFMALFINGAREATNAGVFSKPWMSLASSVDNVPSGTSTTDDMDTDDGRDQNFPFVLGFSVETPTAATPATWLWRYGAWFPDNGLATFGVGRIGSARPYWAFHTNSTRKAVNDGIGYRGHDPLVGVFGSVQVWQKYPGEGEVREMATRGLTSDQMQRDGALLLSNWDMEEGQGCLAFDKGYLKNHLRINPFPTSRISSQALDRVNRPPILGVWQKRQGSTSGDIAQKVYALSPGSILKMDGSSGSNYLRPIGHCRTADMWDQSTRSFRLPTAFQFNDSLYVCSGFGPVRRITNDKVVDAGITPLYGEIGDDQTNPGWREYDRDGTFSPVVSVEAVVAANAIFLENRRYGWIIAPYNAELGIEGAPSRPMFMTAYADPLGANAGNGLTAVNLDYLPKHPQADVSHFNVYRTTADGGTFKFVGRVPVNQSIGISLTAFADSTPDTKLGSEIDSWLNYPPPQNARIGIAFGSRALYFGVQEAPDTLFYSKSGQPGACPKAYQIRIAAGQSTELTGGVVLNGRCFIFTRSATYALYDTGGDISVTQQSLPPVQLEQIRDDLGCISHHGIVVVEGVGAVIPTERGLYLFTGTQFSPLGGRPDDRIMQFWETLNMSASRNFVGVALRRKQQYILYCSTVDSQNDANDRAVVWDWAHNALTFQTNRDILSASVIADEATGQERVWCTTLNGNVFEFDPPDLEVNADGVVAAPYSGTIQDQKLSPHSAVYSRLKLVTGGTLPTAGDGLRGVNLYITNGAGTPWSASSLPLKILWNDSNWVLVDWHQAGASSPNGFEWRLGAIAGDWTSGLYGTDSRNIRIMREQVNFEPSTGTTLIGTIGYDELTPTSKVLDPGLQRNVIAGIRGRGRKFQYRFYDSDLYGGLPNNPWEVVSLDQDLHGRGGASYLAS